MFISIFRYLSIAVVYSIALIATVPTPSFSSVINDSDSEERIGFSLKSLSIYHQGEWRNLSVDLDYLSNNEGKAVDVVRVRNYVRLFLEEFPNTTDFWEVMNKKLVHEITDEFPEIRRLTSQLSLAPDNSLSFPRRSTIFYEQGKEALTEYFGFTKLNYQICNVSFRSLDLNVAFQLKDNPSSYDYPDYQWVDQAMEEFFQEHPISFSNWSEIKPRLEAFLLERFTTLSTLSVSVTIRE